MEANTSFEHHEPWNKGKLVGQKVPLRPKDSGRFGCACRWKSVFEN